MDTSSAHSANHPVGFVAPPSVDAVSPTILRAEEAFRRDLDDLLATHYRQWVAYHGDQKIGFDKLQPALIAECLRRGLKVDEFIVFRIVPEIEEEVAY